MRIDDDESVYCWWDGVFTADPTSASAPALEVTKDGVAAAGSPFAMIWTGVAVQAGTSSWTRTARTVTRFVGTSVTAGAGETALGPGRSVGEPHVTWPDGQRISGVPTPIDVS